MTTSFSFPEKQGKFYTRLTLRKYERPKPGSQVQLNVAGGVVIALPIPTTLVDSMNMEISNPALELLGNSTSDLLTAGKTQAEEFKNMAQQGKFSVSQMTEIAARSAALAPGISDTGVGRLAQTSLGVVRNPHITTIFEGVRLKQYQFSWRLSPESQSEAQRMNNMIRPIKTFMHPALGVGGFALEYPYLATVVFEGLSKDVVPTVKDSFITGMTINGSGTGAPSFFRDGQPVSVELELSFQEINIQTREDILSGPIAG
jgi:hypothetical protein